MVAAVFDFEAIKAGLDRLTGAKPGQGTHWTYRGDHIEGAVAKRQYIAAEPIPMRSRRFRRRQLLGTGPLQVSVFEETPNAEAPSPVGVVDADPVAIFNHMCSHAFVDQPCRYKRAPDRVIMDDPGEHHFHYTPVVNAAEGSHSLVAQLAEDGEKFLEWFSGRASPGETILPTEMDVSIAGDKTVRLYARYSEDGFTFELRGEEDELDVYTLAGDGKP